MTAREPWANEPEGGKGEASGLHWQIKRCVFLGGSWHWCGYVDLPSGHPWAALDLARSAPDALSVHGGITYQKSESDAVRIGFDCAHSGDRRANDPHESPADSGCDFRTYEYVHGEVMDLIAQCAKAAGGAR